MNRFRIYTVIARNELLMAFRNNTVRTLMGLVWLMTAFASYTGWQKYRINASQKEKAGARFLREWEHQEANPHSAAHFGTYLFKPETVLSTYDPGLTTYLGVTYRVEAHVQHEVNQPEVHQADYLLRFGGYSIAMIFQMILPLFILLVTHQTVSGERQGGTLKILQIQGVSSAALLAGKVWGNYALTIAVALPPLLVLALPLVRNGEHPDLFIRYGFFILIYLLYFFVYTNIGVLLSGWFRDSHTALMSGLGTWVLLTILMPKILARTVDSSEKLPSRYEFNRAIAEGYKKGIGNDGITSERYQRYLKETLAKYGVDSVQNLPVNFDGLAMQFGEDYNTKVYEHVARNIEETIANQQTALERASLFNPFLAVQQLSMGFTATDYPHHLAFFHHARAYRDRFIRVLNMDLAHSGSEYLSYTYKAGPDFFRKMEKFEYKIPPVSTAIQWHYRAALSLLGWIFLCYLVLLPLIARKLQ